MQEPPSSTQRRQIFKTLDTALHLQQITDLATVTPMGTLVQRRISRRAGYCDAKGIIHHLHNFIFSLYHFFQYSALLLFYIPGKAAFSHLPVVGWDIRAGGPWAFIILLAREVQGPDVAHVGVGRNVLVPEAGSHSGWTNVQISKMCIFAIYLLAFLGEMWHSCMGWWRFCAFWPPVKWSSGCRDTWKQWLENRVWTLPSPFSGPFKLTFSEPSDDVILGK